ncbi:MAG: glutamate--tRNA ligase [Saprospiraceae bacterium]|nr:glutamate--tRNA ligase [Saprospiraceae bacterium]
MKKAVRLRFAPSPTGPLHIGGVRTALFNFLFVKKHQGTLLLRIEDTDRSRYQEGAEAYIRESLEWCGIQFDEGPYRQSDRQEIYRQHVGKLLDAEYAYYAFDTVEDLDRMREEEKEKGNHVPKYDAKTRMQMKNSLTLSPEEVERRLASGDPYTIRLRMPEEGEISFDDAVRGEVSFATRELDDKIIMKSDGWPTYHLANVIDDYTMEISHVIRGEEWLSSTAHHIYMYRGFGWEDHIPQFAHIPLILKPSGKGKLSKRDGQKFGFPVFPMAWKNREKAEDNFEGFDSFGFSPAAVINFLAFLGWNPGTEQEIFSMEQLIEAFSLKQVAKSGAKFDFDKARWFNQQHLQDQAPEQFLQGALPFLKQAGIETDGHARLSEILGLVQPRVHTYQEVPTACHFFYSDRFELDVKTIRKRWKPEIKPHFEALTKQLSELPDFESSSIKVFVSAYLAEHGLSFGQMLPLLRVALTGAAAGPDLFKIMELLGREEVFPRFARAPGQFEAQGT